MCGSISGTHPALGQEEKTSSRDETSCSPRRDHKSPGLGPESLGVRRLRRSFAHRAKVLNPQQHREGTSHPPLQKWSGGDDRGDHVPGDEVCSTRQTLDSHLSRCVLAGLRASQGTSLAPLSASQSRILEGDHDKITCGLRTVPGKPNEHEASGSSVSHQSNQHCLCPICGTIISDHCWAHPEALIASQDSRKQKGLERRLSLKHQGSRVFFFQYRSRLDFGERSFRVPID